ncbi:roundabout homolog 1-like [Oculina patagonica]
MRYIKRKNRYCTKTDLDRPKVTSYPLNAGEGDNVTLSCNADGNPEPTISWTRNRSPMSTPGSSRITFSDNKKQLTITNVNRTDSGEYRCVANNSVGNIFLFYYQPKIASHPLSNIIKEGRNVTLSCNTDGNPVPTISWTRNGDPVDENKNSRVSFTENKKQLTIINVNRTDSGEYRCVANNSVGNDTSNVATLDVQYPPEIIVHPEAQANTEGVNVTLSCIADGNPVPTKSWTRNGFPMNTLGNSRIRFSADKKQLTITNVNRTDSGEYRCVANNSLGNDTSNTATLDIQYQPKITAHPLSNIIKEGHNVTISCKAEGNPEPKISWTRNGIIISFAQHEKQLAIVNVNRIDSGEYQCVANNSVGTDTSNVATLDVQYLDQPKIIVHPEAQPNKGGDDVTLSCNATGNPEPTISWTRNGFPIDTVGNSRIQFLANNNQLTITNINRTDSGKYRCVANNSLGNVSSNAATLDIQIMPDPPKRLTVDSKSSRVVNISWMVGFDGKRAIQIYTVKISKANQDFRDAFCQGSLSSSSCVVPSSSTTASLEDLFPWTTYYIRVFAMSIFGTSVGSSAINVTTR